MKQKLFGVVPPIITPVDEYERVDEKGLRLLIDHCIDHGIHGIFVCGSNGECMALTQAERDRAIRIALDECAGRVPVIAGVMDSSTKRVIENVKRFEDMGGQTAVVTPVFYARHAAPDETVRHFEDISAATEADLMIYNIPMFTDSVEHFKKLSYDVFIHHFHMNHWEEGASQDEAEFRQYYDNGNQFLILYLDKKYWVYREILAEKKRGFVGKFRKVSDVDKALRRR